MKFVTQGEIIRIIVWVFSGGRSTIVCVRDVIIVSPMRFRAR